MVRERTTAENVSGADGADVSSQNVFALHRPAEADGGGCRSLDADNCNHADAGRDRSCATRICER